MKCGKDSFLEGAEDMQNAFINCNSNEKCTMIQMENCSWEREYISLCTAEPVDVVGSERFCVWHKGNIYANMIPIWSRVVRICIHRHFLHLIFFVAFEKDPSAGMRCKPGEVSKGGECKCGSAGTCNGNLRGNICSPKESKCICSQNEPECEIGKLCKDGRCFGK